jgi:hypothetical protein
MKHVRVVVGCAAIALALPLALRAQMVRGEAQGLMELETAVKWSQVSSAWRDRRPSWLNDVKNAETPQEIGTLAVELESAMGWGSVRPAWKRTRPGWVKMMTGATTPAVVAQGLLQLEAATKWEAVEASWKQKRPGWVERMKRLAGETNDSGSAAGLTPSPT